MNGRTRGKELLISKQGGGLESFCLLLAKPGPAENLESKDRSGTAVEGRWRRRTTVALRPGGAAGYSYNDHGAIAAIREQREEGKGTPGRFVFLDFS